MNKMDIFNELIKYEPGLLQKPLKELIPISFIGSAAIQAYRVIVSKLPNLPMTQEQKEKTLRDGQDAGKMLLAIETRIGELLPSPEEAMSKGQQVRFGKLPSIRPEGVSRNMATIARTIAHHPAEVEEVIKEAEEAQDIPTKTAVINKVRLKREQEYREKVKDRKTPEIVISLEEELYLMKLEKCLYECPKKSEIPKEWHEEPFKQACSFARIIYNRLEALLNERKNIES